MKIVHITTVHKRIDARIFLKEVQSLAEHFGNDEVYLIVGDGEGSEVRQGIKIYDIGAPPSARLFRFTLQSYRMFLLLRKLNATVVHFHDPELLLLGLVLKLLGAIVVYDIHEDYRLDIKQKPWLHPFTRNLLSKIFAKIEDNITPKLDGVITATPRIADNFRTCRTCVVRNYPIDDESLPPKTDVLQNTTIYIGGIGEERGLDQMINAINLLPDSYDPRLVLAGRFPNKKSESLFMNRKDLSRVDFLGWLDRSTIAAKLAECKVGLVVLQPSPSNIDSLPVKLFEYMSAGLPVIASHFPAWSKIVETHDCGLVVDPTSPDEIANSLAWLFANTERACAMGKNGRKAVHQTFNWRTQERLLINYYSSILSAHK